ncbi:hypothetical protein RI054_22g95120 [Pseudoscourfieldia marina]
MRGSFARCCAGAIEAANNRTVASVLKRFEGISAEEAKALGEGTIKVSELKTVKAIHAKTMYAPEETVYERVSFPFELACATVVGVIFGGTWKMYHWNERRKINDFYAKHGEMYGVKR